MCDSSLLSLTIFSFSIFIQNKSASQQVNKGKKLADDATAKMIRGTATNPHDRRRKILEGLQKNSATYKDDPYAIEFGFSFQSYMTKINVRILDPPTMEYEKQNFVVINKEKPGSWEPSFRMGHRYVVGKELKYWAILDLARLQKREHRDLLNAFKKTGQAAGVNIGTNPKDLYYLTSDEARMEQNFERIVQEYEKINLKLELIMVIFEFKISNCLDNSPAD